MNLLKRLFAGPETVGKIVSAAVSSGDALVFTDEERKELYSKMWLAAVPSALSRRLIAVALVGTFCILILLAVIQYAAGATDAAEFTFRCIEALLLYPVGVIVGFYFLTQVAGAVRGK